MPQEKQPLKPDIISSIFSRRPKRRLSSLFIQKKAKAALGETPISSTSVIKKILPFGLDIGTDSIKIVQLGYDRDGAVKIINQAVEELPKEARIDPKERAHLLPQVLKKIVDEKGLKGNCFATAPPASVKIDLIRLPQMPPDEIDKALRWEIRQTAQVDLSETSLDYVILEGQGTKFTSNQINILAITAPKKDIFEHLALLESVGLNPLAIDIGALADLASLDYARKLNQDEVVLFLDFGAGKTSLHIIYNKELISTRDFNVTGNSLTKAVSDYCQLPWEEAEGMKKTLALNISGTEENINQPVNKTTQVKNAILPLLENMVQDIEHTFKYFSYQVTQSQITRFDKIILSGGSSILSGFGPFLRSRLNAEVEILAIDELGPRLNVALGLALRGVE